MYKHTQNMYTLSTFPLQPWLRERVIRIFQFLLIRSNVPDDPTDVKFRIRTVGRVIYLEYSDSSIKQKFGKGKGKVHPCIGTEALHRQYDP